MESLFVGTAIFLFATIFLILILRKRSIWNQKACYKVPVVIISYIVIISTPPLIGFAADIHTPYSLFYFLINYPVIRIFDIDRFETILFSQQSLRTSNMTFALLSIAFWSAVSLIIGILLFIKNRRGARTGPISSV